MLQRLRTALFWLHLIIGVTVGLVVAVMSITGALLGFEKQIIAAIDGVPTVTAHRGLQRLPLDTALARAGIARADVAAISSRFGDTQPLTVRFRERGRAAVALDPYTAETVVRPARPRAQSFFSAVTSWHRYLGGTTAGARRLLRPVTGAANLFFLLLVLSGLYLWFPRRWTAALFRAAARPDFASNGKARDFNWHTVTGFWMSVPLFFIVLTAVFMSYQWPGRWLDRALGTPDEARVAALPVAPSPPPTVQSSAQAAAPLADPTRPDDASLAAMWDTAQRAHPAWRTLSITMPTANDSAVSIAIAEGNTFRPDLRTTLLLNRSTLALHAERSYSSLSVARKLRAWVRFGHTGESFGLPGQFLATLASALGGLLAYTGFALALRRLWAWRRRRARGIVATTP